MSFLIRVYQLILKGPNTLFTLDDFWNYRGSNYMSLTVYFYLYLLIYTHLLELLT